jgi:NitT/TauT family transport system substrate-binding protein
MPSSGITKPADLAGKTIAVNLTQNIQTLTTSAVLAADGVNASSLHYVQIPFPDMGAALAANRVDAISAVEPFLSAALAAGGKLVTSTCTGSMAADFPLSGYVTTKSWAQQHAAAAKRLPAGPGEGQRLRRRAPERGQGPAADLHQHHREGGGDHAAQLVPDTLTAAPLQRVAALMKAGGLATPSDVASLLLPLTGDAKQTAADLAAGRAARPASPCSCCWPRRPGGWA